MIWLDLAAAAIVGVGFAAGWIAKGAVMNARARRVRLELEALKGELEKRGTDGP